MSDDARRIAELEEQLRQAQAETERYRTYFQTLSRDIPPELRDEPPPTEEEAARLLAAPPGTPFADVIAEVRRELS